jgi:protein MpaA
VAEPPAHSIKPSRLPDSTPHALGRSVQGATIESRTFNFPQSASNDVVLLFAGIHGDEPTTAVVADRLVQLLDDASFDAKDFPRTVIVIPRMNPDGLAAKTRINANRVDLNRNFPASNWKQSPRDRNWNGPSPLSEPESRILHDLVEQLKPTRILALHSIRAGRHGVNFDGPAQPLAELMAGHNGYAVLPTMGYPTPGSFGSWAGIDRQIPVITLELPSNQPGEQAWLADREALLAFIRGR